MKGSFIILTTLFQQNLPLEKYLIAGYLLTLINYGFSGGVGNWGYPYGDLLSYNVNMHLYCLISETSNKFNMMKQICFV